MSNSFSARGSLSVAGRTYEVFRLPALETEFKVSRLPYSMKVLLENLLRFEDGKTVTADDIRALANWDPQEDPNLTGGREIAFRPARVLMQDFTGVPAVVDLAAMRDAMKALGGDPDKINPLQPAELVTSTTPYRSTPSAERMRWISTPSWNTSATRSATRS